MTTASRTPSHVGALGLLLSAALALTGCGSSTPAAKPLPSSAATSATATATASPTATDAGPGSRDAQVVEVTKFGVSFELPKGWTTLDAKKVLRGPNPVMDDFAQRMGMTHDQLVKAFSTVVQTYSITDQGASRGFLDNVNTVGVPERKLNDDLITMELATVKAKPGAYEHATTPAGPITRVPYELTVRTVQVRAVLIVVDTGHGLVSITVSSSSAAKAAERADQVQATLKPIGAT